MEFLWSQFLHKLEHQDEQTVNERAVNVPFTFVGAVFVFLCAITQYFLLPS